MLYTPLLALHNILRWLVVALALLTLLRAYSGWLGQRQWQEADRRVFSFFAISLDVQVLLGLLLYLFFSPITRTAFLDFGAAMSTPELRFFTIEHSFYMLLALVLAHVVNARARRQSADSSRFRFAALGFSVVVLLLLLGIPWSRPLLPGL